MNSDKQRRLIGDLIQACRERSSLQGSTRESFLRLIEGLFADLGGLGDPELVEWVILGLHHSESRIVGAATLAAECLLCFWPASCWPQLDELLRKRWIAERGFKPAETVRQMEKALIDRLPEVGTGRIAGLLIMACHANGFVRERAVEELGKMGALAALPVLTLRLDDWVEEVRACAGVAWRQIVAYNAAKSIAPALPLILKVLAREKVDTELVWNSLARVLNTLEGKEALKQGLVDARANVARTSWSLITKLSWPPPPDLLRLGLESREAAVRLKVVRTLVARGDHEILGQELERLAGDRFTPIRLLAFEAGEDHFPERLEGLAKKSLGDSSLAIRRRCQEFLVLKSDIDPVPIYRKILETEDRPLRRAAALLGLAETSDGSDRTVFEAHLTVEHPPIRAAAVFGLGRLADRAEAASFFQFLEDPSPWVTKAAEVVLTRHPWSSAELASAFTQTSSAPGRRAVVKLIGRLTSWDGVILLLDAHIDPDPTVRTLASQYLDKFLRRGWLLSEPSAAERELVEVRLRSRPEAVSECDERMIRFILRSGG